MDKTKRHKILKGKVISDRMEKTAVVLVRRFIKIPKYEKYVKVSKHFKVHDEKKEYKTGDWVEIQETRPISRDKRWKIIRLVERAAEGEVLKRNETAKGNKNNIL